MAAARRLLGVAPNHGLARAVVAFDEARQGALPDAVQDVDAVRRWLPDNPGVLAKSLYAHLAAATLYAEAGQPEQSKAALAAE